MDTVAVYSCFDSLEADLVRDLLAQEGIEALVVDHRSSAFPFADATNGRITVDVMSDRIDSARSLLRAAITSEVLRGTGSLIE